MNGELPDSASRLEFFRERFRRIQGFPPFPWQERLFQHFCRGSLPDALDLPTGLGKTSVMAIWYLALRAGAALPRRLVYVVDRRAVVDQATTIAETLKDTSNDPAMRISTLRGRHVDNREWLADPAAPAIIVGTVDMIGSRLLFSGYGVSRGMRPYHAGLLGADTLVVLDEAHLVPPFEALLEAISTETFRPNDEAGRAIIPGFRLLSLSATGRERAGVTFRLAEDDLRDPVIKQRLEARKHLTLVDVEDAKALTAELANRAWRLATAAAPARLIVFCNRREEALKVKDEIGKGAGKDKIACELLVGERRVHERERLFRWLAQNGFVDEPRGEADIQSNPQPENALKSWPEIPAFLIATSAGEVGVDLDADHMVCDLVEWERMVQRLGRVNRRGGESRAAVVDILAAAPRKETKDGEPWPERFKRISKPVEALKGDGSPAAIVALKNDPTKVDTPLRAQTPAPLRPALARPLVDVWSMTSLEEHTGRPDIQPWLRGWVEDDEPQAMLAWRRWLPWRDGDAKPIKPEVEDFLDAAPVHLEEMLEAPTWRILDWLIARAKRALDDATKAKQAGELPAVETDSPALIMLDRKHRIEDVRLDAWTAGEVASLGDKERKREKDMLLRRLTGRVLVVSSHLGGLTEDGMLDEAWSERASVLDDGWDEQELRERIGYWIIGPGETEPNKRDWRVEIAMNFTRPEDTESEKLRTVRVYVARGADSVSAGDPAIARKPQGLREHQEEVARAVGGFAESLGLSQPYRDMLAWGALHHDLGKDRSLWQNAMAPREPRGGRPWAKSTGRGDGRRLEGYRHEFGSLRDVEISHAAKASLADFDDDLRDLALHLIASHHGHARPSINPYDPLGSGDYEPIYVAQARARVAALRFARLQRHWGPWGLAWWEAIFRAADRKASAEHDASSEADRESERAVEGK